MSAYIFKTKIGQILVLSLIVIGSATYFIMFADIGSQLDLGPATITIMGINVIWFILAGFGLAGMVLKPLRKKLNPRRRG